MRDLDKEVISLVASQQGPEFDPGRCLEGVKSLLDGASQEGGEYDPLGEDSGVGICERYVHAADSLLRYNHRGPANALLLHAWDRLGLIQRCHKRKKVHRAILASKLAILHIFWGNLGLGARWSLLAHADDVLGPRGNGGGSGRQLLQSSLGMGAQEFARFVEVVENHLEQVRQSSDDWSTPYGLAEHVVVRFPMLHPEFSRLYALPSPDPEFALSRPYCTALLERVHASKDKNALGNSLEELASYLFLLIPGWLPRRNMLDEKRDYELDLVVRNLTQASNLASDLFGRHFLVECKNWKDPVPVEQVGFFLHKMRLTHARFGVILAKKGITGQKDETAARDLIRRTFNEDGSTCVVMDSGHLQKLADGEQTFWPLLLGLVEATRFGTEKRRK